MKYATAFKICVDNGAMVFPIIYGSRCYIAVAKQVVRRRSELELHALNAKHPTDTYSNIMIDDKKYLQKIERIWYMNASNGVKVTKELELKLKSRCIELAQSIIEKKDQRDAA